MASEKAVPIMSFHWETTGNTGVGNLPRSQRAGRARKCEKRRASPFSTHGDWPGSTVCPGLRPQYDPVRSCHAPINKTRSQDVETHSSEVLKPVSGGVSCVHAQVLDSVLTSPQIHNPQLPALSFSPSSLFSSPATQPPPSPPRAWRGAWHRVDAPHVLF